MSELSGHARLLGMNDTEYTLYWATVSWLEKDVPTETGIHDADTCRRFWLAIERVRALFRTSLRTPLLDPRR